MDLSIALREYNKFMEKNAYYINEDPDYLYALAIVHRGKHKNESDDEAAKRVLDKHLYAIWLKDKETRQRVES